MLRFLAWTTAAACLLIAAPAAANGRLPATVNVDSYESDFILLPTTFGLLVSNDGGSTYEWICESNVGYGGTFDPDYSIAADGSVWATTFEGLRVSRDGGCTWETQGGVLENRFIGDVEIGPDDRVWAGSATGGESNDVFVSSNNGESFESAGLFDAVAWWRTIRVAPSDGDRIYVSGFRLPQGDTPAEALLRVSSDGGANWTTLAVDDFAFGSQPNLYLLGVHPTNPDVVFARVLAAREPSGDDVYRSDDGGQSWTKVLEMKDFISAFTIRADGQTVIVGTVGNCVGDADDLDKGCVRISSDGGVSFEVPATEPKMACVHERGGELLACGANWEPDNFALGASADGQSWEKLFRFSEIAGPLSCPETSPQYECAAIDWPPLCVQLGICSATPDAGLDAGEVAPPKGNCLGCNAGGGLALGLIVLLPWARRRRR